MKRSFCTDKTPLKELKAHLHAQANDSQLINTYKELASGRMDVAAIVQLIEVGQSSLNLEQAFLKAFRIPLPKKSKSKKQQTTSIHSKLTKGEYQAIKLAYDISQADLASKLIGTLLYDDKFANSMEVLAQLKEYISIDSNSNNQNLQPILNVNLSKKAKKKKQTNTNSTEDQTQTAAQKKAVKRQPLKLVNQ